MYIIIFLMALGIVWWCDMWHMRTGNRFAGHFAAGAIGSGMIGLLGLGLVILALYALSFLWWLILPCIIIGAFCFCIKKLTSRPKMRVINGGNTQEPEPISMGIWQSVTPHTWTINKDLVVQVMQTPNGRWMGTAFITDDRSDRGTSKGHRDRSDAADAALLDLGSQVNLTGFNIKDAMMNLKPLPVSEAV